MARKCLEKIHHKTPNCDSNSLQVFLNEDDSITGYCFSCNTFVPDPYGGVKPDLGKMKVKSQKEVEEEIREVRQLPHQAYFRQIKAEYWAKYGVRSSCNTFTGKPAYARWFPTIKAGKLVGYKAKLNHKDVKGKTHMWFLGNTTELELWGWEVAKRTSARTLYITEGEEDCLAVDMILTIGDGEKFKQLNAVVSLPNGTKSVAVLGRQAAEINRRFEEVVLVFDDDDAGRKAIKDALVHLPKAHVVLLPSKDANQCIVDNKIAEAHKVLKFRKAKAAPAGVVKFREVKQNLYTVSAMGIDVPWGEVNTHIRGLHHGLYTIAGGEGLGKTSLVHQMIAKNCEQGIGVLAYMGEETKEETYLNVGNKIIGRDATKPDEPLTVEESDSLDEPLDNLYVYDVDEDRSSSAEELKDNILDKFRELLDYTEVLYIDNLTKITESIPSAAERNDFISGFAAEMDTFARRTKKIIIVLSHFNKQPKNEVPYAEGGRGNSNQLAGGAGLARYSLGIFYVERNTQGVDPSCIKFRIGKNRKGKWTGFVKMYYERHTTRTNETDWNNDDYKTAK